MFALRACTIDRCHHWAYGQSGFCYHHSPNQNEILRQAVQSLSDDQPLVDLSVSEAHFTGFCVAPKRIAGVNLAWSTFTDVDFSGVTMVNSFFDFCLFERCRFNDVDVRYSVFAGSRFVECDLSQSLFIHTNFSGIKAEHSNFGSCDFYYATFHTADLRSTSLEDCNLKKTDFRNCALQDVSVRYSNWEEAHR
jgi:uncharacterized protein YjbI with pentapeptide repeats